MDKKIILFLGIFLIFLSGLVFANLTFDPSNLDFGSVNQNENKQTQFTITNPDQTDKENVTFVADAFSYSNQFIGANSFNGQVAFNPNEFNIGGNGGSQDITSTISIPLTAAMGQYFSVIDVNYVENGEPKTQQMSAKVLVNQITGQTGDIRIKTNIANLPSQISAGRNLEFEIEVENNGAFELANIRVESWIFDETINQIVAFDESETNSIGAGRSEKFDILMNSHEELNGDDSYTLYIKAFKTDAELAHRDVKFKSFDIRGVGELCNIGDLVINKFSLNDDEYEPGDIITINVEVENDGNDEIEDVQVEVWLSEKGKDKKIEREKSSRFDLDEDEVEKLSFELELDDDIDEGDYEVHVVVSERGNEERQCVEEIEDISVERPNRKVVIKNAIVNPSTLSCSGTFNAEIEVKNVGRRDEDSVRVRMQSTELGINELSEIFSLDRFDRSDNHHTAFLSAQIPEDAANKEYVLTFTVFFDNLGKQNIFVERITVANCANEINEIEEQEEVTTTGTSEDSKVVYLPTGTAIADFLESNTAKTIFWIVADIALLIIAIYFIVTLFRRNKSQNRK